jgi:hypothetical protein
MSSRPSVKSMRTVSASRADRPFHMAQAGAHLQQLAQGDLAARVAGRCHAGTGVDRPAAAAHRPPAGPTSTPVTVFDIDQPISGVF